MVDINFPLIIAFVVSHRFESLSFYFYSILGSFLKFIFKDSSIFNFMRLSVLPVYMHVNHMHAWCVCMYIWLWAVVSCHAGSRKQIQVLWKNSKYT